MYMQHIGIYPIYIHREINYENLKLTQSHSQEIGGFRIMSVSKTCKSCGRAMISNEDYCPTCRNKKQPNYIRKNATFNKHSKIHMEIWNWCKSETEDFKAQNFADFVREKLKLCMEMDK